MHDPSWYVIKSGDHVGMVHLAGWAIGAVKGLPTDALDRGSGWMSYGICPRCHALVLANRKPPFGDQIWAHERWHAITDYPIPPEVLAEAEKMATTTP